MSLSAYYGTGPSKHVYVDTSQPLSGLGAPDDLITIYEGVGGIPSRATYNGFGAPKAAGCGCKGARGRLSGFGNEVILEDTPPIEVPDSTTGPKVQTYLVGALLIGSLVAVGLAMSGPGSKSGASPRAMKANRRRNL